MLSLPSSVRVFLCRTPTDLRFSFDGLMALAQRIFEEDPLSGHLFLFINRRRDRIKILFWDRDGLCIWYKRLEVGTSQFPSGTSDAQGMELDYSQLAMLLGGIDLRSARQRKRYRRAGWGSAETDGGTQARERCPTRRGCTSRGTRVPR
jgi:transposase